jgi:hypothetical protein
MGHHDHAHVCTHHTHTHTQGYLFLGVLLNEEHQLVPLVVQSISHDLAGTHLSPALPSCRERAVAVLPPVCVLGRASLCLCQQVIHVVCSAQ